MCFWKVEFLVLYGLIFYLWFLLFHLVTFFRDRDVVFHLDNGIEPFFFCDLYYFFRSFLGCFIIFLNFFIEKDYTINLFMVTLINWLNYRDLRAVRGGCEATAPDGSMGLTLQVISAIIWNIFIWGAAPFKLDIRSSCRSLGSSLLFCIF